MGNTLVTLTRCSFSLFPLMYGRDLLLSRAGWRNYAEVSRINKEVRDQIPPHNNFFLDVIPSF